ncbi:hypothetical protein LTR66_005016 [Elasticomyces elasticus]|nr:hypothetical protein LTR50_003961 [Elasticomyces elasticus]KAK4995108.1 hypothetical protein LTR66_005016 [Elasticomyces elasticus]
MSGFDLDDGWDSQSSDEDTSPIDGYFSQRPQPRDTFVEVTPASSSDLKTREAAENEAEGRESQPSTLGSQRLSLGGRSSNSLMWVNEGTPLLDAGLPPPAYSAGAYGPQTAHVSQSQDQRYQDQPAQMRTRLMPLEYGSTSTLAPALFDNSREPQSMRDNRQGIDPEVATPDQRRRDYTLWRRFRASLSLKNLFHVILIGVVVSMGILLWNALRRSSWTAKPGHGDTTLPTIPNNSTIPAHPHLGNCGSDAYSETGSFDFDSPAQFTFLEFVEQADHVSGDVSGKVYVRPAPPTQQTSIQVNVSLATTGPWDANRLVFTRTEESLYLKIPRTKTNTGSSTGKPCIDICVHIYLLPSLRLTNFELATQNLDVDIDVAENLFDPDIQSKSSPSSDDMTAGGINIANATDITTINGGVSSTYWSSRETRIDVTSGSVSGTYALRDLLSIKTKSGSISVDVVPKSADRTSPRPADFSAISAGGSITARFPITGTESDIPEREYRTRVQADSGSLHGTYIHGLTTSIMTTSGSITADILPYSSNTFASSIHTETHSGTTRINVLPPFIDPGTLMERMHSVHHGTSGGMNVKYPQEWVGSITGETMSGSLSLRGKDVRILSEDSVGPFKRHVVAMKGKGGGVLDFKSMSGSIDAIIGDL